MLSLKDIHTTEEPQTIVEPQDIMDTTEELQDVHTTDGSKKVPKEKLKRTKIKNAQEMQASSSLKETDRVSKETEEKPKSGQCIIISKLLPCV